MCIIKSKPGFVQNTRKYVKTTNPTILLVALLLLPTLHVAKLVIARPLLQRSGSAFGAQQSRLGVHVASHERRESGNVVLLQGVRLGASDSRRHLLGNRLVLEQNGIAGVFAAAWRRNRLVFSFAGERPPEVDVDLLELMMVYVLIKAFGYLNRNQTILTICWPFSSKLTATRFSVLWPQFGQNILVMMLVVLKHP